MTTWKIKSYDIPYIKQAAEILKKDPRQHFTNTALALEVGINAIKLQLGFKQVFNQTIHYYTLDLRLNLARELLEETDLTIAEVGYKSGFKSRDVFTRCFRKKYDCAPRDWRKIENVLSDEPEERKTMIA